MSIAVGAAFLAASCITPAFGQSDSQAPTKSSDADNTKTNQRDRQQGAVTADQQKENAGDRALAQKIRQAIMADKSLSTYAHNVKVVAKNDTVTLKGPVRSEDEKAKVESIASQVAGSAKVTNEITVKAAKEKSTKTKKVS
jgi:osmotically-inducible protein OsmY